VFTEKSIVCFNAASVLVVSSLYSKWKTLILFIVVFKVTAEAQIQTTTPAKVRNHGIGRLLFVRGHTDTPFTIILTADYLAVAMTLRRSLFRANLVLPSGGLGVPFGITHNKPIRSAFGILPLSHIACILRFVTPHCSATS
jgi:hypothetical protein